MSNCLAYCFTAGSRNFFPLPAGLSGAVTTATPCPRCGAQGVLRPHVVWFGEPLDPDVLNQAIYSSSQAEIMFSIGTSGIVQPAASLVLEAKRNGAFLVEINPEITPQTRIMDISLQEKAGDILPKLVDHISWLDQL